MAGDPPIIISGASVTIEFDESTFPPDPTNKGKYKNANKKIKRIEITGGGLPHFDEQVTGNDVVIKIYYNNP